MPNHIRNVLRIKVNKPSQLQEVLNRITSFDPDDPLGEGVYMDFNKIIPEPKTEAECPKDCLVTPDSHIMVDKDRPWFDWYKWHVKYWDIKWNAYDCYTIIRSTSVQFAFSTAWSVPSTIYSQILKLFPDYHITVKWADENFGSNCGEAVHTPDDSGWSINYKENDPKAKNWAKRLWDKY